MSRDKEKSVQRDRIENERSREKADNQQNRERIEEQNRNEERNCSENISNVRKDDCRK